MWKSIKNTYDSSGVIELYTCGVMLYHVTGMSSSSRLTLYSKNFPMFFTTTFSTLVMSRARLMLLLYRVMNISDTSSSSGIVVGVMSNGTYGVVVVVTVVVDVASNQLTIPYYALNIRSALNQKIPLASYLVHLFLLPET